MSNTDHVILSISRVHNGSIALFVNYELVFHIENERLSNIKYDGIPAASLHEIKKYVDHVDVLIVTGVGATVPGENYSDLNMYALLVRSLGKTFFEHDFVLYDLWHNHHELHAYHSFYNSGFDRALCVIKDGMGSEVYLEGENFLPDTHGREVGTVFVAERDKDLKCVEKHIAVNFDLPLSKLYIDDNTFLSNTLSEGLAYQNTAENFGFHKLDAGKVMGMSAYGKTGRFKIIDNHGLICKDVFRYRNNDLRLSYLDEKLDTFDDKLNFAADLQEQIENKVIKDILDKIEKTGETNICLSGGFFLNCVANYKIRQAMPDHVNMYVEPVSSDAGTAIGGVFCVEPQTRKPLTSIYNGLKHNYTENSIKEIFGKMHYKTVEAKDVAKLVANQHIVAVYQGKSESGPRALGNRSILFDPRETDGKDTVNRVKKREWFRPFAASVLEEHAPEWFDMRLLDKSPYMMHAVPARADKICLIPAVLHVDNTCRIQTVSEKNNPFFRKLIEEFYAITGVPMVLNTSFNLAGDAMVETLDDAKRTIVDSEIDYLYLPEFRLLIRKI